MLLITDSYSPVLKIVQVISQALLAATKSIPEGQGLHAHVSLAVALRQ